jgi:hypothetical protein
MNERDLKRILTKPTIDNEMDRSIADVILNYESGSLNNANRNLRNRSMLNNSWKSHRLAKVAVIVLALVLVGTGTVLAAGYKVKSHRQKIKFMTNEELGEGTPLYGEDTKRTFFGSGDEAFAELGYPNLIPSYIYDNYLLSEKGHICLENNRDGVTQKWLITEFFTDGYETGDFSGEYIYISFIPSDVSVVNITSVYTEEVGLEEDFIFSEYTTKGGVICSLKQHIERGYITADILFDSDTIGNGSLMMNFSGIDMDKVKEILDTLPLTEETIENQDMGK